jgi:hypothetical protein
MAPYVVVFLFLIGVALILFAVYIWKAREIVALGLGYFVYVPMLLMFSTAIAVIVFGVSKSYATYTGKHFGGVLKGGGTIVGVVVLFLLGVEFPPPSSNFPLTVYVHGPRGNQDVILRSSGEVRIDTGGLPRKAAIGKDGEAFFPEIPANFRGQEVKVSLDADGYELTDPNETIRLEASSVYVLARRKSGHFAGHVWDDARMPLPGVRIAIGRLVTTTDIAGYFQLDVPGEELQPEMTLQALAPGYVAPPEAVVPNSNEITLTLHHAK